MSLYTKSQTFWINNKLGENVVMAFQHVVISGWFIKFNDPSPRSTQQTVNKTERESNHARFYCHRRPIIYWPPVLAIDDRASKQCGENRCERKSPFDRRVMKNGQTLFDWIKESFVARERDKGAEPLVNCLYLVNLSDQSSWVIKSFKG